MKRTRREGGFWVGGGPSSCANCMVAETARAWLRTGLCSVRLEHASLRMVHMQQVKGSVGSSEWTGHYRTARSMPRWAPWCSDSRCPILQWKGWERCGQRAGGSNCDRAAKIAQNSAAEFLYTTVTEPHAAVRPGLGRPSHDISPVKITGL